jgi:hypothetical protein
VGVITSYESPIMNEQHRVAETPMLLLRKDPDDGICNLCLQQYETLSEEHVPPQCTGNTRSGTFTNCFPELQRTITVEQYTEGISYATVCRDCNRELGERYDGAISRLYGTVRHNQRESDIVKVRVRPNAIMRGIMGHFVSAKTTHSMSVSDDVFRRCARNPEEQIPENYHFYVIYYPYRMVRIVRDIVMIPNILQDIRVVVNVVKIDPIAFIITDQPFLGSRFIDWNEYVGIEYNREANVSIPKTETLPYDMPESDPRFSRLLGKYAYQSVFASIEKRAR